MARHRALPPSRRPPPVMLTRPGWSLRSRFFDLLDEGALGAVTWSPPRREVGKHLVRSWLIPAARLPRRVASAATRRTRPTSGVRCSTRSKTQARSGPPPGSRPWCRHPAAPGDLLGHLLEGFRISTSRSSSSSTTSPPLAHSALLHGLESLLVDAPPHCAPPSQPPRPEARSPSPAPVRPLTEIRAENSSSRPTAGSSREPAARRGAGGQPS